MRTNYISFASLTNNLTTNFNLITITNDSTKNNQDKNINSYTYLMKSNANNSTNNNNHTNNSNLNNFNGSNSHQRHMSVPVVGANDVREIKSLPTSSSTFQASINQQVPNMSSDEAAKLYENVKMKSGGNMISLNINNGANNPNTSVSYENINLEYINRLMNEGYSKENVVAALGISRNNFEMACDILHQFVNTHQTTTTGKVCENNR
jgi:hypothetical protein